MLMNAKIILVAMLAALSTLGSSCIREGFLIPVNLTVNQCYPLIQGPAGSFNTVYTIALSPLLDASLRNDVKAVRFYDMKVSTTGVYGGLVAAQVYVNNVLLASIGGAPNNATAVPWSTFSTSQSLLGSSPYIKASSDGVTVLVLALNRLVQDENASLTLRVTGVTAGATLPAGLSVCLEILAQADVEMNSSGNGSPID
jgi:hypothetical protein